MTLVQKKPKHIYMWGYGEKIVDVTLLATTVGRNSTATLFTADNEGTCTFTAYLWAVTTGQYTYARIYKNGTQIYEFNNNLHSGDSLVSTTFDVDVGDIISAESYCQYYDNNLHDISVQQQVEGFMTKDIKKVYLGSIRVRPVINFATQGPCPNGFHVPTMQEWVDITKAVVALGLSKNNTTLETYLKMPTAGYRREGSAIDNNYSNYWAANYFDNTYAYMLQSTSSNINPYSGRLRSMGLYIRPFSNFPITPDSSWTTLHQGSGSAGIFWNSTLGLISISSDGTTWYTLKDKNLGATTVFNYGDTLTDDNCGNVFQRGNNYAFPGTKSSASISKSGTQVDVTGYGPGNYYSRGVWVTASPRQNSASNGNNLRGGVDGNVPV